MSEGNQKYVEAVENALVGAFDTVFTALFGHFSAAFIGIIPEIRRFLANFWPIFAPGHFLASFGAF